jgi:uncharacterized protein (TIGR03663 family)
VTPLQRCVSLLIIAIALAARIWALDYKPAHIDEGVNGSFADAMRETGHYAYDPANYHGPLHFYVLFASQTLFGRSLWALRLPTVLIGTATVALLLAFRRHFSFRAAAYAAVFLAVSPGMVFYSRYAIHEMWLPFFALLAMHGGMALARGDARKPDLWRIGIGIAGMILTKETWLLHFIAAALAGCMVWLMAQFSGQSSRRPRPAQFFGNTPVAPDSPPAVAPLTAGDFAQVAVVSYGILIAFYSGFGFNWSGVSGMITTFAPMAEKGTTGEGHNKETFYWLKLLAHYEWPAAAGIIAALIVTPRRSPLAGFLLMAAGAAAAAYFMARPPVDGYGRPDFLFPNLGFDISIAPGAFTSPDTLTSVAIGAAVVGACCFIAAPARHPPARWLALYTLGSLAAYSLIPYKTPWCLVNVICPACLVLGHVIDRLSASANAWLVAIIPAVLTASSVRDTLHLNFVQPTADNLPETRSVPVAARIISGSLQPEPEPFFDGDRYAYVQTTFDINELLIPLRALVARDPRNRQITGHIFGESSPLAWLLNDFPNIQYHAPDDRPAGYDADFLIVPAYRESEMDVILTGAYFKKSYSPRGGGTDCFLYLAVDRFGPVLDPPAKADATP